MKILVAGASGATGIRLIEELLNRGHEVKAIVRSPERLPEAIRNKKNSLSFKQLFLTCRMRR